MYRTNVWLLTPLFLAGFSSGSFATCEIAKESTFRHDEIAQVVLDQSWVILGLHIASRRVVLRFLWWGI